MSLTLREMALLTGVLCFGALIGAWLVIRHVNGLVERIMRAYVPSKPVYVPDKREYYTTGDLKDLKASFDEQETLTMLQGMNAAERARRRIADAARRRRRTELNEPPVPEPAMEGTVVARPYDGPPAFRPDIPPHDVNPAVGTRWDANLTLDLDDAPDVAAAKLAVKYFGSNYATPALAGSQS